MRRAVELSRGVLGTTSPNPPVGAVVLDRLGEVVGEGATQPPGGPHAEVVALRDRDTRTLTHRLDRASAELTNTLARLRTLSPAATLKRGYAVLQREDGHAVRAPGEVEAGETLRARVSAGEFTVRVGTDEA